MNTLSGKPSAGDDAAGAAASPLAAQARRLMLISAVTTLIAIAAVAGVIGYRVFHAGGSSAATITDGVVMLPKDARVVSTAIADGHIVVTLDAGGTSEVRIYDLKTLQQTGRLRFATPATQP
jgi:hypothetical protein